MTTTTGQRSERAPSEIGALADHLGWLVLGVIICIILSLGSIPSLPRFSSEASWQVAVAGTTAVVAALLWYIAEKGIRLFWEVVGKRGTRHGGGASLRRTGSQRHVWCTRSTATLWAFGLLFGAVVEELFWRGVIWQLLLEAADLSLGWVVVITSAGFALTHLNSGLAGAFSKLFGGLALAASNILFGSVLLAVIMHLSFNALVLVQYGARAGQQEQRK